MIRNLVSAIFILFSFAHAKDIEKVSLQLQYFHQFQFAGYYIAKEKGFYSEVGLDLDIKEFKVGVDPVVEVLSGRADYAIGRSSLIVDRSKGRKIVLLASILQSTPSVVMSKKSSGISTVEDFKGKKIAIIGTEESDSVYTLLKSKKIDFDDMKVEIGLDRFKKLLNNEVDIITGYTSNQPFYFEKAGIEINIFDPKDYGFDFYSEVLFTSEDEVEKNKNRVFNFTQASLKGWEYAFNNIDETIELILEKYNPQNKSKESLLFEANVLKELAFYNTKELGNIDLDKIQRIYDMFHVIGIVENKIDFNKFIYNEDKKLHIFSYEEKLYLEDKKEISVCVKSDWLPYETIEDGKFSGISADFFNLISQNIGVKLKIIHSKDKNENIKLLKEKKCDIKPIMSLEGEKIVPYKLTKPYLEDYFTLTTRNEQPFIVNFDEYMDKEYVVVKGHYALIELLKEQYPTIQIKEVDTIYDALKMVSDEKVFGYFGQSLASIYYIQRYFSAKLKVINDFESFDIGFGVVEDDKVLLTILNKAIDKIPESKKREILNNWISISVQKHVDYMLIWELVTLFVIILSVVLFFLFKQKRLQKELQEQKEVFETLYNKSSDGILLLENNRFIDCNESVLKMLGYEKEEIVNSKPFELSPMFQPDGTLSSEKSLVMNKIALDKGSNCFEWLHKKANGEVFWVEVVLTKININQKDILHVSWRDVNRKKELEIEILQINRKLEKRVKEEVKKNIENERRMLQQSKLAQMGEMISMIAHQWRQPLGAIAATTINLKTKIMLGSYDLSVEKESEECNSYFNKKLSDIENYVQLLTKTIDDFRYFYKPNKESTETIINSPIDKAIEIADGSLKNIDIIKKYESNSKLLLFESEIMQVILNILQNAQDNFQERQTEKPTIFIDTYDSKEKVFLKICDNGGGISDEIILKIFDPYFSTKHEKNGTGLGLYMSKTIIDEHHSGKMYVSNNKDGVCFTIELPVINSKV